MRNLKPSFIPGIIWLIISTILFCLPGSALPKETWLEKIWFDKWVHIGIFFIMLIVWCWAFTSQKYRIGRPGFLFFWLALIGVIYGAGMEIIQYKWIPNRDFEIGDIVADAIGCVAGFIFSSGRFIKK